MVCTPAAIGAGPSRRRAPMWPSRAAPSFGPGAPWRRQSIRRLRLPLAHPELEIAFELLGEIRVGPSRAQQEGDLLVRHVADLVLVHAPSFPVGRAVSNCDQTSEPDWTILRYIARHVSQTRERCTARDVSHGRPGVDASVSLACLMPTPGAPGSRAESAHRASARTQRASPRRRSQHSPAQ